MSSDLLTGSVTITDKASTTLSAIESKFLSIIKAAEQLETVLKRIDKIKVAPTVELPSGMASGTASATSATSGASGASDTTRKQYDSSGRPKTRGKYRTKKVIEQEARDAEEAEARKLQRRLDFRAKHNLRTDRRERSSVSGRAAIKDIANSKIQTLGGTKSGVFDREVKRRTAEMHKAVDTYLKETKKASELARTLAESRREQDRIMAAKRNKMLADANEADRRVAAANKKAAEENRKLIRAKSLGELNRQFKSDPSGLKYAAAHSIANVGMADKFGLAGGRVSKLGSAKSKLADMATAKLVKGNLLLNKATKSTSDALRKFGSGIKTYTTETSLAAKSVRKGMDGLNAFRKSTSDRIERNRNDRRTRAMDRRDVRERISTAKAAAAASRLDTQRRFGRRDAVARDNRIASKSGASGDYMKNQLSNLSLKGAGSMKANAAILSNVAKELGAHLRVGAKHIASAGRTIAIGGSRVASAGMTTATRVQMAMARGGARIAMAGTTTATKISTAMMKGGMGLRRNIASGVSMVNSGIRGMLGVVSRNVSKLTSQLKSAGRGGRGGGRKGGMLGELVGKMGLPLTAGYAAYKAGKYLVNSSDEERNMRKKMVMMPDTFGVAREDNQGRTDWIANRYKRARQDSIEGLDGAAIIKSATDWAFKLGADPSKKDQGFDNFEQAEDFARTLQAMSRNTGASASEMGVMEYQLQQVGAKGHAEMLDIKPLIQSAPTLMAELGDQMGMTFDEMMNSGKDKSLTWDKMKDAVLALKEKHLALAKQEQMMTAEGQVESGLSYIKASIQAFNDFIHKIFVDNQVIFTFFKMFGDVLSSLGESIIGTSEETDAMRGFMIGLMFTLDLVVRVLGIVIDSIVTSVKMVWNVVNMVGRIFKLGFDDVKSGVKGIWIHIQEFFYGLKYNVPMAFKSLAYAILNAIYKILDDSVLGKLGGAKDKIGSLMADINSSIEADEARKKEDPELKRLAEERKVKEKEDRDRKIAFLWERVKFRKDRALLADGFKERTKKSFQQLENDYWMMEKVNKDFAKEEKSDLKPIKEDTSAIAGGLKKANKSLEILREIAGYQVVNTVTNVRPNHTVNFGGDIRMDGVGKNNVMPIITDFVKKMNSRIDGMGQQANTTTVTVGSP